MAAALLALVAALTCARAEIYSGEDDALRVFALRGRSIEAKEAGSVRGCMYGGRWFTEGAAVRSQDACLRCRCARGALSCARASCAPAPDPPPRRCVVLHRRNSCCPELHCPDGVKGLELEATGRLEEESWDVATPATRGQACVEEGTVFSAGSALAARAACEQCFCLGGVRRCVRPRCLPPPPGCAPRPAPGACCPSRYYCEKLTRNITTTSAPTTVSMTIVHRLHDCKVNGELYPEGEQVAAITAGAGNCTQCFCLRGVVRCQLLSCAPALRGCQPLLRPGQCCPHQYQCPHKPSNDIFESLAPIISTISDNSLISKRYDDRSFRSSVSTKSAFLSAPASISTTETALDPPPATTKVKRKTSDLPSSNKKLGTTLKETKATSPQATSTKVSSSKATLPPTTLKLNRDPTTMTTAKLVSSTETTTTARTAESTTTEQPEGSVKVVVNGTINCTAELSSTFTNMSVTNKTDEIEKEVQPRISEKTNIEAQTTTLEPTEIITDRNFGAGYAEGDSFVINVTSSLSGNSSRPFTPPALPPSPVLTDITHISNMTKKPKEDYDYDYTEPTLPPSLPNLKIIPFVAADAVVDEDVPAKNSYTAIDREDKFPVYYPTIEQKEVPYATRREDVYHPPQYPTQYPVFVSEKRKNYHVPKQPPTVEVKKPATIPPTTTTTAREQTVSTPEMNLFSPPAETEGGFIPKGPGLIDEYFAVYPSTPPPVPHLTTSMQINSDSPDKVECVTPDGRRVPEGESVTLACSVCSCAWAELHCAPRRCPPLPPTCRRRPAAASSADLCCGEIICTHDNTTTPAPNLSTRKTEITLNVTKVPIEIESYLIPFDPPADRSVPQPSNVTADEDNKLQEKPNYKEMINVTSTTKPETPTQAMVNISTSMPLSETKENLTTRIPEVTSFNEISSSVSVKASTEPTVPDHEDTNTNDTQSHEYEDEDDDEGFSFGSVLKLLLSDNYDATTTTPKKKSTIVAISSSIPTTTLRPQSKTTRKAISKPTPPQFIPVQPHAYIPPKKLSQNTVNRINHLVLGEATAIKKTTPRPVTHPFRPISTPNRKFTHSTTRKPIMTSKITTQTTKIEETSEHAPPIIQTARPSVSISGSSVGSGGAGLLKLAGCNIYGMMYRVGRIIAELSTPCQECRCTELGVQCLPLSC